MTLSATTHKHWLIQKDLIAKTEFLIREKRSEIEQLTKRLASQKETLSFVKDAVKKDFLEILSDEKVIQE